MEALVAAIRASDAGGVHSAIAAGANPRLLHDGETPLHLAARLGPLAIVEALIEDGALEWRTDAKGRTPLDAARDGHAKDREAIIAVLDCGAIADPSFRVAVDAIRAGDVALLASAIDAEPRLLYERIAGPDVYRKRARDAYFRDPKLFWFVANNPTQAAPMAPNIVEVAQTMIDRGVERDDLDYTLGLVMTSSAAREQGHQRPLMRALMQAGASITRETILSTAAHRELDALRAALEAGTPLDAPIAAALGDATALQRLVAAASREDITIAFGLAVINRQLEAARIALEAGADIDAFLPVHAHSTALHQAAGDNNVPMIELLLARGARTDRTDSLWDGTPLDWAMFAGNRKAAAALRRAAIR